VAAVFGLAACRAAPAENAPPSPLPASVLACPVAPALAARACPPVDAGAPQVACADLAPKGSPDVEVLTILVARGAYDLGAVLGIPSMQSVFDASGPGAAVFAQAYHDLEGPHLTELADGRNVKVEGRGLMLGGVVRWASLPSPRGAFTSVVIQQIPLHDAPLADADRKAIEAWDLAALVQCIDARLWPRTR
jgi:hypothetical protein